MAVSAATIAEEFLQQSFSSVECADRAVAAMRKDSNARADGPSMERKAGGVVPPPPTGPKTNGIGSRHNRGGILQLA